MKRKFRAEMVKLMIKNDQNCKRVILLSDDSI